MKKILLLLAFTFLIFSSCKKDEPTEPEVIVPDVVLNNEINEFIWEGMNYWYYWQADQPTLADNRKTNRNEFYKYLNGFSDPEDLFESLVFQPNVVDDFSWYIPDVDAQLDGFRGISKSYGIGLPGRLIRVGDSNDVVIFISFVVPDSPAAVAGLKRGDIISRVDGVAMNIDNATIINKIFSQENISLGLANVTNGVLSPIAGDFNLTAQTITSNPINHFSVIEEGGKKIGYLVMNSFTATFNGELNDVFDFFSAQNVDELILDLRYNGGGSVLTSALLASMIKGNVPANTSAFARLQYNSKRDADEGFTYPFLNENYLYNKTTSAFTGNEALTRLQNIARLYVITGTRTASASEMMINGLRPYMPVKIVGEKTVGKNEGSITVVDSPGNYSNLSARNPNHTVGMQPIVFQVYNSANQSDYTLGFNPDIEVIENQFYADIKEFGDTNEALLRTVLNDMLGTSTGKSPLIFDTQVQTIDKTIKFPKFSLDMYLMDNEININF